MGLFHFGGLSPVTAIFYGVSLAVIALILLIAVAIGMISPGPVAITATFVGYLVAGFRGSLVSTVGIFLPSFLLVLIAAPILLQHRGNPNVQGFVRGAYAAAIGTILGACILLAKIAVGDWLTALIGSSPAGAIASSPPRRRESTPWTRTSLMRCKRSGS